MRETGYEGEKRWSEDGMEQMGQALHELCQPLTTVQCRLELAGMIGSDAAYREAVNLALVDFERISEMAIAMRQLMQAGAAQETGARR